MNLTDFLHHILVLESYKTESCREERIDRGWKKEGKKERRKQEKGGERKSDMIEAVKWTGKATNICRSLILDAADINESWKIHFIGS